MRLTLMTLALAAVLLGGVSPSFASVGIAINDDVQISVWNHGQSQGPFKVTIYDDDSPGVGTGLDVETPSPFLTFCVETHEYFYNNNRFNINDFSNITTNSNKLLTGYSAWVYDKFVGLEIGVDGTNLLTTTFGGVAVATALNAYQKAIWAGVITYDGSTINSSYLGSALYSEFGIEYGYAYDLNNSDLNSLGITLDAFKASDWANSPEYLTKLDHTDDVRVINIHSTCYPYGQDQLILMKENQPPVPEPASFVIWSMIAGMCWLGMRRAKAVNR